MSTPKLRSCSYAAPNCSDVDCANPDRSMRDRTLPDGTLILPVHHDLLTTPERMIDRAIDEIVEYSPHYLYCDPTHLALLVRAMARRGGPPVRCEAVSMTYNFTTAVSRRQIVRYFSGAQISDILAMTEFGWLGLTCPLGRTHMNARSYYLEFLKDDRPAEPGEIADLYVTSLGDRLSPHIRYHTRDLYTLAAEPCACGERSAVVRFEGRSRDALRSGGKLLLTTRQLDDHVGAADWMDLYQMRQTGERQFSFKYVANDAFESRFAASLEARLREALGLGAELQMEKTRYIPGERSGKLLSCVGRGQLGA